MPDTNTITMLNELIQISEDGKIGFAQAGRKATASELKTLFETWSCECGAAATELQGLVMSLGGFPKYSGTISGAAHRGWAKVRSAGSDTNFALLEEVERSQDVSKAAYAEVLAGALSKQVHDVVRRQFDGVVRHHDEMSNLRSRYKVQKEAMTE